jgi:AAA ATPase domain
METGYSNQPRKLELPFIGRKREIAQLQRLHAQGKHALILGPPGAGKTALVARLREKLSLIVCAQSKQFTSICKSLEAQLDLEATDARLPQRKQRLLRAVADAKRTVVFDGVGWTTPKLSSFLECVMERVPMWLCARSEHSWDIGHFWRLLVRFGKIELHPFRPAETRECVAAAVAAKLIPREALNIVEWLHHRSNGCPLILRELLDELANGKYNLNCLHDLRLLDLDRRIHALFPTSGEVAPTPRRD